MIFVFGSNEGGHHGAGAALQAYKRYGAKMGQSYGLMGDSFGIPTKDKTIRHSLSLKRIERYIEQFKLFAEQHPEVSFQVTRIGCGLAGFKDEDIAPLFYIHPANCQFDTKWAYWLPSSTKFWGTY